MTGTVLILGSTGRFGRNAAEAFWNAGWQVRTFTRGTEDLQEAAHGADVIVNAWNPDYQKWAELVPGLTRDVIAAAQVSGATVVVPGNVYVFGTDAPQLFGSDTPHAATNPLGRVRIEMEAAYRASGVRTIILRGGDFLDTEPSGNWFDRIIAAKVERGRLSYPGAVDVAHAWAYLPDMANALVGLCEMRDRLEVFEDVPFAGYTLTGDELAELCGQALGQKVTARRMNWLPLRLAAPLLPMVRGVLEMRYLWNKPHRLDGSRLEQLLPAFRPTDPAVALRSALKHKVDPDKPVARDGTSVLA